MKNKDVTLIIMSCDNFSDLWDGQVGQLEKYWPDHPQDTYLVTDKFSDRKFDHVRILAAGDELEWSERLHAALEQVSTKYVFLTLDDYFLIDSVPNELIDSYIRFMDEESYDYIRLFHRRKKWTTGAIPQTHKLRNLDMNEPYAICLYAGLWKTDFLKTVSEEKKNAWRFEVSLTKAGRAYDAKCAVSMDKKIYPFLDVVRKGKLLRKAARYFKKNEIYHGSREVNSFMYEFKLGIRTFGSLYAPKWLVDAIKRFMIKRGHHYYSEEA